MKKTNKNYKWILCNKWFIKKIKPIVLTEEEKTADKPPNKEIEYDYIPRWTPIGISAGITQWWDSEEEVWERTILTYNARNLQQNIDDGKIS